MVISDFSSKISYYYIYQGVNVKVFYLLLYSITLRTL